MQHYNIEHEAAKNESLLFSWGRDFWRLLTWEWVKVSQQNQHVLEQQHSTWGSHISPIEVFLFLVRGALNLNESSNNAQSSCMESTWTRAKQFYWSYVDHDSCFCLFEETSAWHYLCCIIQTSVSAYFAVCRPRLTLSLVCGKRRLLLCEQTVRILDYTRILNLLTTSSVTPG